MLRSSLTARVGLRLAQQSHPSRPLPSQLAQRQRHRSQPQQRAFSLSSVIPYQPLSQVILDTPLPSYALTIIALTIILRGGLTLPFTIWQRKRMARMKEIIAPAMKKYNEEIAEPMAREARRKGYSYDKYRSELKKALADKQSALHKEHGTHPTATMLMPMAVNIPILITTSMAIRTALTTPGSAMAAEHFAWLSTLGEADPVGALSLIGALLAFSNAELGQSARNKVAAIQEVDSKDLKSSATASSSRSPSALRSKRLLSTSAVASAAPPKRRAVPRAPVAAPPASSSQPEAPAKLVNVDEDAEFKRAQRQQNTMIGQRWSAWLMRGMGVAFIPLTLNLPSALVLYWTSSMAFTLAQTAYFTITDKRAAEAEATGKAK